MNYPRTLASTLCNVIDVWYHSPVNTVLIIIAHIYVLTMLQKDDVEINHGMGLGIMLNKKLCREHLYWFYTLVLKCWHYLSLYHDNVQNENKTNKKQQQMHDSLWCFPPVTNKNHHYAVMTCKLFLFYWPVFRGIHRSVGQQHGYLILSLLLLAYIG